MSAARACSIARMASRKRPLCVAATPSMILAMAQPGELAGRGELGVLGGPLLGQIQPAGVGQGQHLAVEHHDPDHAVGGLALGAAPRCDRREIVAATDQRHRQAGCERREIHGLPGRLRVCQHPFGYLQPLGDLVPVNGHAAHRSRRRSALRMGWVTRSRRSAEHLVGARHVAHGPEESWTAGECPTARAPSR